MLIDRLFMKIEQEKTQEILEKIVSKCSVRKCPMCGESNWNIENKIFELREFNSGNLVIGGKSSIVPLLAITCTHCGNTQLVNAIMCGAIDIANNLGTTNPNKGDGK